MGFGLHSWTSRPWTRWHNDLTRCTNYSGKNALETSETTLILDSIKVPGYAYLNNPLLPEVQPHPFLWVNNLESQCTEVYSTFWIQQIQGTTTIREYLVFGPS